MRRKAKRIERERARDVPWWHPEMIWKPEEQRSHSQWPRYPLSSSPAPQEIIPLEEQKTEQWVDRREVSWAGQLVTNQRNGKTSCWWIGLNLMDTVELVVHMFMFMTHKNNGNSGCVLIPFPFSLAQVQFVSIPSDSSKRTAYYV